MLNIIWSGLIIISILVALGHDILDEWTGRYSNNHVIELPYSYSNSSDSIHLYNGHRLIPAHIKNISTSTDRSYLIIPVTKDIPILWQTIAQNQTGKNKSRLQAKLIENNTNSNKLQFVLPEVHWVKIRAISQAAFDMAEFAV